MDPIETQEVITNQGDEQHEMPHCEETIQPEKVSVYDPSIAAYREVSVDHAKEMIAAADQLKKQLTQTEEKS